MGHVIEGELVLWEGGGGFPKVFIIRECCLHINGQFIEWRQLWDLFEKVVKMRVESLSLSLLKT